MNQKLCLHQGTTEDYTMKEEGVSYPIKLCMKCGWWG